MTATATSALPAEVKVPTLVPPTADASAVQLQRDAVALLTRAEALTVTDEASCADAAELGAQIQKTRRALEELRERFKRPALEFGRAVDGFYKPAVDRCDAMKRSLGERIFRYQDELRRQAEERRRQDEERARQEAEDAADQAANAAAVASETGDIAADIAAEQARIDAETKQQKAEQVAAAPVPVIESGARAASGGGASIRMEWTFEVTDRSSVPREFLVVDDRAIAAFVKAKRGQCEIPGVRIFQRPTSSWRG